MNLQQRIENIFNESIEAKQKSLVSTQDAVLRAGELMAAAIQRGNKIMACGNGGSAADSQHFAAELVNRFERERRPLAGLALTTDTSGLTSIANDYSYDQIYAKQVIGLGKPGDLLVGISTSGNSPNVIEAIHAAHENDISVVALTGNHGGKISALLKDNDIELQAASESTARTQEVHLVYLHCLCDLIDEILYPSAEKSARVGE